MTTYSIKNRQIIDYNGAQIHAYELHWKGGRDIICRVKREGREINLGEANDGSKFQAVAHAINQAKEYIDVCNLFDEK